MTRAPPPHPTAARSNDRRADRGVSEVVSFILTFSMITMMVGVLYTAGFVSLQQLQTGNQMQNAEGVFFAMADSFGELEEGQAPKRAGALDLDVGASVSVGNDSSIDVRVNNSTGTVFDESLPLRSMHYRLDQRAVTYEAGAVFRANKGNSAMVREPGGLFCSNETDSAVVSVVTLVDPEGSSVAAGTVTVTGIQRSTQLLFPTDRNASTSVRNVTIDVASTHETAWDRYFESTDDWVADGSGSFVCEDVDRVYVRHSVIEVQVTG